MNLLLLQAQCWLMRRAEEVVAGHALSYPVLSRDPDLGAPCLRAQLVENPNDAGVFLPRLLPGLEKVSQEVPDPECRSVAAKARDTLLKIVPDPSAVAPPEAHDFKVRAGLGLPWIVRCCELSVSSMMYCQSSSR